VLKLKKRAVGVEIPGHGARAADNFYALLKNAALALMPNARRELPYGGAKEMLLAEDVDNREFLERLVSALYEELPAPKAR